MFSNMTLFNFGFWSLNLNQYVRRDDLVISQDADDNQRSVRKYVPREAINESEVVFYPPPYWPGFSPSILRYILQFSCHYLLNLRASRCCSFMYSTFSCSGEYFSAGARVRGVFFLPIIQPYQAGNFDRSWPSSLS